MSVHRTPIDARSDGVRPVDRARLDDLLVKTSRTFALSIPVLPDPTRLEVTVAYLLFRIADTLEDSTSWSRERKMDELQGFVQLLEAPSPKNAARTAERWSADPPLEHAGYLELLAGTSEVLQAHGMLAPPARDAIMRHTCRTAEGMRRFVARETEGVLRLDDVADLRAYCYAVAGIVGELLTELFLLGSRDLHAIEADLRRDAAAFGEALQLVNILKDSGTDAREGRFYLPGGVRREDILTMAREDLRIAGRYSHGLQAAGAPRGVVEFVVLPILLAWSALDRVESQGPGSKITRSEVIAIVAQLQDSLDRDALSGILPTTDAEEAPS